MRKKQTKKALRVPYALAVHDDAELNAVTRVIKNHKTIRGEHIAEFENSVAEIFGKKFGVMVNSGSSANLLAVELLNLPEGSEVITPMLTFSTTLAPLLQKRLRPVFVDVLEGSYVVSPDQVLRALSKKTRALFIPSLLGNIPDLERLHKIAKDKKLHFIEDSCDTIGATFNGKPSGAYSDISTTSFYGSHVITAAGGGGMILVNNPDWARTLKILRGWGRTSAVTESEDIEARYQSRLGTLPYDSKFIFEKIGYNFLPLEISAAFGREQLKKLPKFHKIRKNNFAVLRSFLQRYGEFFIFPMQDPRVDTNWLAFPLTIRSGAPFSRMEIVKFLEENNIQTRPVFTGTVIKHPAFKNIPARFPFRSYPVADGITERGFVIGCHHGLEERHMAHLKDTFERFLSNYV